MDRKNRRIIIAALVVALFCVSAFVVFKSSIAGIQIDPDIQYRVVSVIDGDTFKVKMGNRTVTVRLLGVDTPETVDPRRKKEDCFGRQASDATKRLLDGRSVYLELSPKREVEDRYGRILAYAYIANDPIRDEAAAPDVLSLNEMLIRDGYAREFTYGLAYSKQADFRSAERDAKKFGYGLWGLCDLDH